MHILLLTDAFARRIGIRRDLPVPYYTKKFCKIVLTERKQKLHDKTSAFIVNPIDKICEEWYSDIVISCKESIVCATLCTDTNDYIKERCE